MELSLQNKTILVTGAGQGIGNELCKTLHKMGAQVVAVSRSVGPLEALKKECPTIDIIQVDLSDWNATKAALQRVQHVDGLVNNAGIAIIKPYHEMSEKDFDDTFNINIKAAFNVCQILIPKMKSGSSIVNISSLAGLKAFHDHSVYSMSKAALDAMTRSLALELGPKGIRCNSVNPTVILTRMGRENWTDPVKADPLKAKIPLGRFGEVNEVVEPIVYLLSDKSVYINGHSLPVEGGYLAGN
ncbi:L-xylulose reductase [Toxorhynchites rutilus septentrionalis]|uniref:L-xylulose reductase n=1 Tax=Toxorhynchites rutilus septentrionalis TaxID=329112 RepID=UPI00247987C2|nr:L-xylulose reductase [Toxorhynchites rutilus septentrionalis]